MSNEFTKEQRQAYDRFIKARDRVGVGSTPSSRKYEYIPHRDYLESYKDDGQLTPLFEVNTLWQEYKEASLAWWAVEPEFRKTERMSMSKGDYGTQDSWDTPREKVKDTVQLLKEGE